MYPLTDPSLPRSEPTGGRRRPTLCEGLSGGTLIYDQSPETWSPERCPFRDSVSTTFTLFNFGKIHISQNVPYSPSVSVQCRAPSTFPSRSRHRGPSPGPSIFPNGRSAPLNPSPQSPAPGPPHLRPLSVSMHVATLGSSSERNHTVFVLLRNWLISLGIMSSRVLHAAAGVRTPFPYKAEQHPIVWMDHILLLACE